MPKFNLHSKYIDLSTSRILIYTGLVHGKYTFEDNSLPNRLYQINDNDPLLDQLQAYS